EIVELAQQRGVLALELLVGLAGCLEHREGEGAAASWSRDDTRREAEEAVRVGSGEHVDHAGRGVGVDLEEEFAEPVDDLVAAVDEFELTGELGRPLGQFVEVGGVGEPLVAGRMEGGGAGVGFHASTPSLRSCLGAERRDSPSRSKASAARSASVCSATGSNRRALAVRTIR